MKYILALLMLQNQITSDIHNYLVSRITTIPMCLHKCLDFIIQVFVPNLIYNIQTLMQTSLPLDCACALLFPPTPIMFDKSIKNYTYFY